MNKSNSRIPSYNNDSDYTTNAPSYYDDLARKQRLIEELASKIWDYEKTLEENIQMLKVKLSEIEHLIGDGFNDVIEDLLREWVNDGTLDHIINEEIFNTKADKDWVDEELDLIYQQLGSSIFYDNIHFETKYDDIAKSTYYITTIPQKDSEGNILQLRHEFQNDIMDSEPETARSFYERTKSSVVINASTWNSQTGKIHGIQIRDGEIIKDTPHEAFYTLGIKEDNTLKAFPPYITASEILSEGYVNAVTGFYPMMENSEVIEVPNGSTREPRQIIAQKLNKDIIILTVDGRTFKNSGFNDSDIIRVLQSYGVVFAYMLDGGGSTSTMVNGMFINKPSDGSGLVERGLADFLYVKKQGVEKEESFHKVISELDKKISELEAFLTEIKEFYITVKLLGPEGNNNNGIESYGGDTRENKLYLRPNEISYYNFVDGKTIFRAREDGSILTDLINISDNGIQYKGRALGEFLRFTTTVTNVDNIKESGIYWSTGSATGAPNNDNSWAYLHIQQNSENGIQLALPFSSSGKLYLRRTVTGGWGNWGEM